MCSMKQNQLHNFFPTRGGQWYPESVQSGQKAPLEDESGLALALNTI